MSDETEADTRANRIDPVLAAAGWTTTPGARVRRELICPGRIMSGGGRGQTKDYAGRLKARFGFSTNSFSAFEAGALPRINPTCVSL